MKKTFASVFYCVLLSMFEDIKKHLVFFALLVVVLVFFSVKSSALEMGVTHEAVDIASSMADDTFSYDDNLFSAGEIKQQNGGGNIGDDDYGNDLYPVFRPDSDTALDDAGDIYDPESFPIPDRTVVLDSGATSTTVSEDIHALREYSEFFLFGFVPITIAVLLLALGGNWFYKTFVSSTFL